MRRGPFLLPPDGEFAGSGVYALFYQGKERIYEAVRSVDSTWPIYVGKAIPPGGRKGGAKPGSSRALYSRLSEHARSIDSTKTLKLSDFRCRYLIVTPLWITMAERFLLEHFKPAWNVCLEGFGNHDPGSGRHQGEISWWDALHPGRPWATRLKQTRSAADTRKKLAEFFESHEMRPLGDVMAPRPDDEELTETLSSDD